MISKLRVKEETGSIDLDCSFREVIKTMMERELMHCIGMLTGVTVHVVIIPTQWTDDFKDAVHDFLSKKVALRGKH